MSANSEKGSLIGKTIVFNLQLKAVVRESKFMCETSKGRLIVRSKQLPQVERQKNMFHLENGHEFRQFNLQLHGGL